MSRVLVARVPLALVPLVLGGCGDGTQAGGGQRSVDRFLGFDGDGAWTWRDDGSAETPDEASLLHGREASGGIELRRGTRWADAEAAGQLGLVHDAGLALDDWSLGGASGRGGPLAPQLLEDGGRVVDGKWSCTTSLDAEIETFYAVFDRTLVLDCQGAPGFPAGTWTFAEDIGLVKVESTDVVLDLVAPW